jgi:hypothetical protein
MRGSDTVLLMRHKDVEFEFLSAAEPPSTLRGAVIVRNAEMVLEVECPGEDRSYVIRGKAVDGFFKGWHEGLSGDTPVQAKWGRLDDIFVGTWIEEGREYLFTFRLPGSDN